MIEIVDIKEARENMVKSWAFIEAVKKINDAILSSSKCGISKTEVPFYAREITTYEAVASLLESKGYNVEIARELSSKCSMFIGWEFDR